MLLFRLEAGQYLLVESLMVMPTVPAMPAMHKEVTAHHYSEKGIISDGTDGHIEDEDRRQGDEQSGA